MLWRYVTKLPGYLRAPISPEECRERVQRQLRMRDESFLQLLERAVYPMPENPFNRLLRHAGIDLAAVRSLVKQRGLDSALEELYDAGVYLSHGESKGLQPVERDGLSFQMGPRQLDNPLVSEAYTTYTGGSRSPGRPIGIDLEMVAHEACHHRLYFENCGLVDHTPVLWRTVPPAAAGIKDVLRFAKIGKPTTRWFTPNRWSLREAPAHFAFTGCSVGVGSVLGRSIPIPQYVPLNQPLKIVEWMARQVEAGNSVVCGTTPSAAVRLSAAASEHGLSIDGTVFFVGGEPFTPARHDILRRAGARGHNRYSMTEVGTMGMPCGNPSGVDDVHVLLDKLAIIQREAVMEENRVQELFVTSLHPATSKLWINVGTGDYADLDQRDCGCLLARLGLRTQIRNIRSYEKLTGGGITFEGERLIRIVEEMLPEQFGGVATDYQFVEEERDGLTVMTLLASPRLGDIDESTIIETVLGELGGRDRAKQMNTQQWRSGRTMKLVRAEPEQTSAGKILALHLRR
jgi:hypothetical protein